jgi:hypothetical protein
MTLRQRLAGYGAAWLVMLATMALVIRDPFDRGVTFLLTALVLLGATTVHERRRFMRRTGTRGRGVFGQLRGWIRATDRNFVVDPRHEHGAAAQELLRFDRFALLLIGASVAATLVLLFV